MTTGDRPAALANVLRSDEGDPFGPLRPGTRIGKYVIVATLAQSGFGITYRARDARLHRDVAIREFLPTAFAQRHAGRVVVPSSTHTAEMFQWGRGRFLDEARELARLGQVPAIVGIEDSFEDNGTAYMVMTLVRGESLEARLGRDHRLPQQSIERLLHPLLDGLGIAHEAGIVHGDIKPANILIDGGGRPTLVGFAAARSALLERIQEITAAQTPGYAAPEQTPLRRRGPWTDIYGLAGTLYHCVAGVTPKSAAERLAGNGLVTAGMAGGRRYAPSLLAAIDAGLKLKEADRPQTIADWRAMFAAGAIRAEPDAPEPASAARPAEPASAAPAVAAKPAELAAVRRPVVVRHRTRAASVPAAIGALAAASIGAVVVLWPGLDASDRALRPAETSRPADAAGTQRQDDEALRRTAAETARKAEQEAARRAAQEKQAAEMAARRQAEQAERERLAAAAAARRRAQEQEEAARKAAQEKQAAELAERNVRERAAAADARRRVQEQEEAARKAAQEKQAAELAERTERERTAAADARRRVQEQEEATRKAAQQKAAAEAAARKAAEEKAAAEAEARRRDEQLAAQAAADAVRRQAEERARLEAEARRIADELAWARAEAEVAAAARQREEETRRAAEAQAMAEAARKQAEAEASARAEEDARRKAEEEARRTAEAGPKSDAEIRRQAEAMEAALRLTEPERKRVQAALTAIGHDVQSTSGVFGPRTRSMIAAWQKSLGLPDTGYLTVAQIATLEVQAAASLRKPEPQQQQGKPESASRSTEAEETALGLSEEQRKRVQVALNGLGHEIGNATGFFGPRTRSMIAAWQKKQGLPETGFLNAPQLATLQEQVTQAAARREEAQRKAEEDRRKAEADRRQGEADEAALKLSDEQRKRVQVALNGLGHEIGTATGFFGPRTRSMIAAWQKKRGLPETGFLSAAQLATLDPQATPAKPDEARRTSDAEPRQPEAEEAALRLSEPERRRVQVALTALGHEIGTATGYFGPRTRAMITAWQKKQGLPETGYLTAPQLADLRQQAAPALARYDAAQRRAEEERRRSEAEQPRTE